MEDTTITVQTGLNTLYLDFDVPVMNNLELGMNTGNSDLYRNSTGSVYPYTIGNIASITGHNSPNSVPYHYFFYNLRMKENCVSDFAEATAVFMLPSLVEYVGNSKQLIKTVDILGRNAKDTKSEVLFYIYDDGTVDKKIIIE